MFIAKGVEMLEISMMVMGAPNVIYPTVIWNDKDIVLVDTGVPGQVGLSKIRQEMLKSGISFDGINKVIITHQDLDHIGGLPSIIKEIQHKIEVRSHEKEKPYIQGEKRLIKITDQVIAQLEFLPNELKNVMKPVFENPPKANVDQAVVDGEELPFGEGVVVIHTPGHTPGHICLYIKQSKTLIAGDAMSVQEGQLFGPDPQQTIDMVLAVDSLKKLAQYDIETVICYHGGVYRGDVNRRIEELIMNSGPLA